MSDDRSRDSRVLVGIVVFTVVLVVVLVVGGAYLLRRSSTTSDPLQKYRARLTSCLQAGTSAETCRSRVFDRCSADPRWRDDPVTAVEKCSAVIGRH